MSQIHPEVATVFEQRYHKLTRQMIEYVVPLVAQVEYISDAVAALDDEFPNLSELFTEGLQIARPPFEDLCDLLKQMNKYFNWRGLYLQQVNWAQDLLRYFLDNEQITGKTIDSVILNTIASGYTALGMQEDALEIYDFILDLYKEDSTHPGLATIFFNAANAHLSLDNYPQALDFCQRSIEIDRLHGNQRGIAIALMMLADLLHNQKDTRGIFQSLNEAATIIQAMENRYLHAQLMGKLALYMAIYFDWERAETLFKNVIPVWREIGDDEQLAIVLFNYASLLYETGRQPEALTFARESLQLLEKHELSRANQVKRAIEIWQQNFLL